ncbi:ABC1 protein [Chlorella sorokiniana]|uniref:ABC1 protein n=1 Tax=Chlorella sorokiniana TaxID=3076 RepID=A0A2P6TFF9_CHLSO|nr:ABC1 protein [Chlorella sorokiniana]|eukprot:PRW32844.1 ABC1 protein [Chlorella sorokiniana]
MLRQAARRALLAAQQHQQHSGMSTTVAAAAVAGAARRLALGVPALGLGTFAAVTDEPHKVAYRAAMIPVRLGRDVWAAASMLADYAWTLHGLEGDTREEAKKGCHQRGADRLLAVCFANGGIYIKLGQHIGMLDHLLPSEYVHTMREHMLDRCPVSTYEQVRQTIQEDFGCPVEQLFAEFGPEPIASASLAQVHEAIDHDGQRLAVKVQHRGLRETSALDLATIDVLAKAAKLLTGGSFDYQWLVDESMENLPLELDFLHEAQNSARCASNLDSKRSRVRGRVAVPAVDLGRTSHRVMTMEFVDGVKVTDLEALKTLGADPGEVSQLISECFNEMIFTFGDVHCDPHAANMLVRRTPPPAERAGYQGGSWQAGCCSKPRGQWQLVLLDHGLYRQLDDSFRLEYAGLWHSLVFADEAGIRRHSSAMNAGDAVPLFVGMLTQRPWEKVTQKGKDTERLRLRYTEEERAEIQDYAAQYAREIGDLLRTIPRPLLLLLKTNDCLRAVDVALGSPVNSFVITARECTRALARDRLSHRPGLWSRLAVAADVYAVELRMAALRAGGRGGVLAERFAGEPDEPTEAGALPVFRLAVPDNGADEASTPHSYDASRRSVLTPSNLAAFLGYCYGQELESDVGDLGCLLEVGKALGSPTLPTAVDKHLAAELLQNQQMLWDLSGAAGLATKLVRSMGAVLPLLSHRKSGSRRNDYDSDHDWEQAFDRLDAQCKRMAFTLARAMPEERQEQDIAELGRAAAYCAEALEDSGWAGRRGAGSRSPSPGRGEDVLRGW